MSRKNRKKMNEARQKRNALKKAKRRRLLRQQAHAAHFPTRQIVQRGFMMNVLPKKGGEIHMNEQRLAKLDELQTKTEKTAEESALMEALTALKASEQAVAIAEEAVAKKEAEVKEAEAQAQPETQTEAQPTSNTPADDAGEKTQGQPTA